MYTYCHAGPNHEPPTDHGAFGWICEGCWQGVLRILKRLRAKLEAAS